MSSVAIAFARSRSNGSKAEQDRDAGNRARTRALQLISANEYDDAPRTSISHIDGLGAAIASVRAVSIGIDLVRDRSISQIEQRYFLSSWELQQQPPLSLSQRWALKEAAWKALRCKRSMPLKSLELVHSATGRLTGVRKLGVLYRAHAMLLRPWPRYIAAIVQVENA